MVNPFISATRKSADLVTITPELALFLLENYNPINPRPINKGEAMKIARSIEQGEWDEDTGARLIFERNTGFCIDGQTRLYGIVLANIAVRLDILWGVLPSPNTDNGRKRTVGVAIAMVNGEGKETTVAYSKMGAVAKVWLRYLSGWTTRPTRKEIINFVNEKRGSIETMLEKRTFKETRRSGVAAALAVYHSAHPSKAIQFFDALTGDPYKLRRFSPAHTLRDYLVNVNSGKQHPEKQLRNDFAATLAACDAHLNGEPLRKLFPAIKLVR